MMMRRRDLPALLTPALAGCTNQPGKSIRIASTAGSQEPFLAHLAVGLGLFEREGLNGTIQEFSGSRGMESLLGGTSDALYTPFPAIFLPGGQARSLRSIFVGSECISSLLVVSGSAAGRIRRVEDLKGAVVGVSTFGSTPGSVARFSPDGRYRVRSGDTT